MATREGKTEAESLDAKIAAAAAAVRTRVEKHWKVAEEKEANEEQPARNLDFGSLQDTDKVVVEEKGEEEGEEEGTRTREDSIQDIRSGHETIGDVWEEALDPERNMKYYFNRKSGVTQWERPESVTIIELTATETASTAGGGKHTEQQPPASSSEEEPDVWYYRDIGKNRQGPFGLSLLRSWVWYMPMDILVWCDLSEKEKEENVEHTKDVLEKKFRESFPKSCRQDLPLPLGEAKAISFAELLGYGSFLKDWRGERGAENCVGYGIAPTISVYKRLVGMGDEEEEAPPTEIAQGSVWTGSGGGGDVYPHQSVVHAQQEYTSSGFFDIRTRRFRAEEGITGIVSDTLGEVSSSAYWGTGLQHHMDLSTFEQQMQAMKERKKKKLSREAVEKLKARKKKLKRKQALGSL